MKNSDSQPDFEGVHLLTEHMKLDIELRITS